jgi:hypothetical protein
LLDLALVLDKPWIVRHTLTPLVSALDKLEFRTRYLRAEALPPCPSLVKAPF